MGEPAPGAAPPSHWVNSTTTANINFRKCFLQGSHDSHATLIVYMTQPFMKLESLDINKYKTNKSNRSIFSCNSD